MKSLLISLILSPLLTYSQPKRLDNTIIVKNRIDLNSLKSYLFQHGYMVEGSDTVFITSSAKSIGAKVFKFNILRSDTSTIIKGQMKITVEGTLWGSTIKEEFQQVYYVKSKENLMWDCWNEMAALAVYIGSSISYLKQ